MRETSKMSEKKRERREKCPIKMLNPVINNFNQNATIN